MSKPIDWRKVRSFPKRRLDLAEERAIDWIWYPFLAKRFVTILEGNPGTGKSYLIHKVAIALADGEKLPSKRQKKVIGKILFFDLENPVEEVTKTRLNANGCKNQQRYYQVDCGFSIGDKEAFLRLEKTIRIIKPKLVVFDTLNHYVGDVDLHKSSEAAAVIGEFARIAQDYECAVVLVRHLRKGNTSAVLMGQGNASIAGTARIVATVGRPPDDENVSVVATAKNNLGKGAHGLEFMITEKPTLKYPDRSILTWGDFSDMTAEDLVGTSGKRPGRPPIKMEECIDWMLDFLAKGEKRATTLLKEGRKKKFTDSMIRDTKIELRKQKLIDKEKRDKRWYWRSLE